MFGYFRGSTLYCCQYHYRHVLFFFAPTYSALKVNFWLAAVSATPPLLNTYRQYCCEYCMSVPLILFLFVLTSPDYFMNCFFVNNPMHYAAYESLNLLTLLIEN